MAAKTGGCLFVGTCACGAEIEFILPPAVYMIPYPTYLGACGRCGRRYNLDISTRNTNEVEDDDTGWLEPRRTPPRCMP